MPQKKDQDEVLRWAIRQREARRAARVKKALKGHAVTDELGRRTVGGKPVRPPNSPIEGYGVLEKLDPGITRDHDRKVDPTRIDYGIFKDQHETDAIKLGMRKRRT